MDVVEWMSWSSASRRNQAQQVDGRHRALPVGVGPEGDVRHRLERHLLLAFRAPMPPAPLPKLGDIPIRPRARRPHVEERE
jgi:hypothetical protein